MRWVLGSVALLACSPVLPPDHDGSQSGSLRDEPLALPEDYAEVDYDAAYTSALEVASELTLDSAWRGHLGTLGAAEPGCPDLYVGGVEELDVDAGDGEMVQGTAWSDACTDDSGGLTWDGALYWETELTEGATEGSRLLLGDGLVDHADGVRFSFDGDASDSVTWDGSAWTYDSSVDLSVSGDEAFGSSSLLPGGFRGVLDVSTDSAGALDVLGSVFLFDPAALQGRFDSVVYELEFREDCPSEPYGYIGLRGTDGYWFDLYFLPLYDPAEDTAQSNAYPYPLIEDATCDGCGTLFIRNVLVEDVLPICPDFDAARAGLAAPPVDDFVLTLRDLPLEGQ